MASSKAAAPAASSNPGNGADASDVGSIQPLGRRRRLIIQVEDCSSNPSHYQQAGSESFAEAGYDGSYVGRQGRGPAPWTPFAFAATAAAGRSYASSSDARWKLASTTPREFTPREFPAELTSGSPLPSPSAAASTARTALPSIAVPPASGSTLRASASSPRTTSTSGRAGAQEPPTSTTSTYSSSSPSRWHVVEGDEDYESALPWTAGDYKKATSKGWTLRSPFKLSRS